VWDDFAGVHPIHAMNAEHATRQIIIAENVASVERPLGFFEEVAPTTTK